MTFLVMLKEVMEVVESLATACEVAAEGGFESGGRRHHGDVRVGRSSETGDGVVHDAVRSSERMASWLDKSLELNACPTPGALTQRRHGRMIRP